MTVNEAKKILLAADLDPLVREALCVLSPELDFQNLSGEEWHELPDEYIDFKDDYQVSNFSRVRSFKQGAVNILHAKVNKKGYVYVSLSKNGKSKNVLVHVLVAKTFIPNPENKPEVNHENGNKNDNRIENLTWVTRSENIQHALKLGLVKTGCEHCNAVLTAKQVREIRRDCVPGDPERGINAFARKFNVGVNTIRMAYIRETYKDVE